MAILIERAIPSSLIEKEKDNFTIERKREREREKYVELSPIERERERLTILIERGGLFSLIERETLSPLGERV